MRKQQTYPKLNIQNGSESESFLTMQGEWNKEQGPFPEEINAQIEAVLSLPK